MRLSQQRGKCVKYACVYMIRKSCEDIYYKLRYFAQKKTINSKSKDSIRDLHRMMMAEKDFFHVYIPRYYL